MRRRDFLWRAGGGLWAVRSSVARAAPTPRGTAVRGPQKTADGRKISQDCDTCHAIQ